MSDIPLRNKLLRRLSFLTVTAGVLAGVLVIVTGLIVGSTTGTTLPVVAAGLGMIVFVLMLHVIVLVILKGEANINRIFHATLDLQDEVRRVEPMLKMLADSSQISDAVRAITHRESEREALRQAIREEMYSGDWEAALYLIDEMERRFGYKQEAQALREELSTARSMTIEEKITEALSHIEKLMGERRWDRARMEIERLIKLFPRHERVLALPGELNRRREAQKQELLTRWKQAVEREEVDNAIAVLTELDQYLTREEAQQLQDSARHVFKTRLLNLGTQFSLAVSDNRWRDALEVGLQIRQEFPNSRMAQEVSERLEVLRIRAGFKVDAEIVQRSRTTG